MAAHGKILIAGGYLVLDQQYPGLVVATTAAFHTSVQRSDTAETIRVLSPQFTDGDWLYSTQTINSDQIHVNPIALNRNSFVYHALTATISYLSSFDTFTLSSGLVVIINAHNDFYSQQSNLINRSLPRTLASLKSLPSCVSLECKLSSVNKTGLGSSAAMVTSLVKSLLIHFQSTHNLEDIRDTLFKLAQIAHSAAQGKVGSGFDVSAAVFGSHLYTRFNPDLISSSDSVRVNVDKIWDYKVVQFLMPRGLKVVLGDVCGGSSTTGLVSGVLKWKKESGSPLFSELGALNAKFVELLGVLGVLSHDHEYDNHINALSLLHSGEWHTVDTAVSSTLVALHIAFEAIREKLRCLSELANVPIEPHAQTKLLDECISCPGVLCAGVPGAGGFDAIFVILLGQDTKLLEALFEKNGVVMLTCSSL